MAKEIIIYVTCANTAEAEKIAASLLDASLIACANVMMPHAALYRWGGKVERAEEVAIFMKSRSDLFPAIQDLIIDQHSYECPCIVSWGIEAGFPPFLSWINEQIVGEV